MNLSDVLNNINTYIGDSSTDRVSDADRYQAATEATAWLLEELGNEHMVDRAEIEYLPTVLWYKMDNLTPYLLTAGQLRYKDSDVTTNDFTRVEARDLASMTRNRQAYAIERFNGSSYLGITIPDDPSYPQLELLPFNDSDSYTYTGINAENILKERDDVRFDMQAGALTATGLSTTTGAINVFDFKDDGTFIVDVEIPDITDVTSVTLKFGTDLSTAYYSGTVAQDVNGNALVVGVNTIKIPWASLILVGTPDLTVTTKWSLQVNYTSSKPLVDNFKFSDLRVVQPVPLTFKYIFYRVGKNASGTDLIEFSASTDVPFFIQRYPQYKFAVAHKASGILYRSLHLFDNAVAEDREARTALQRYRKNFSGERDMANSTFKVAGINFRTRRIIRRG